MTTSTAARPASLRRFPTRAEHLERDAFVAVLHDGIAVITVGVELDALSVKYLDKAIARAFVQCEDIVLDLRACRACDSASLAMMARYGYLRKGRLQFVVSATGLVRKIFEITGLSRNTVLHPTLESALAALRSPAASRR